MTLLNKTNENRTKKSLLFDFTILFILFLSGGFLTSNNVIPPTISKFLWVFVVFLLFIQCRPKQNKKVLILFVVFAAFILLSTIINSGILTNSLYICIGIAICYMIISSFSFSYISESYNRVLAFLCLFSLIMMALFYFFPSMNSLFRVNNANNTATYSNFIFYVKNNNEVGIGRNWGMFWEPGAFQTFISFALLFEFSKKKPSLLLIILFSLAIGSTFSTTGYFALVILYIYGFLNNYKTNAMIRRMIIVFGVAALVVLITNYDYFFSTSSYSTFGKLILYNTSTWHHENLTSVTIRRNAMIKPVFLFFEKPIFGWGDSSFRDLMYEDTLGVTSCTLINWFAIYGLLPGLFIVYSVINTSSKLSKSILCRIIIFILYFIITMSENYITNIAILLLTTAGFTSSRKTIVMVENNYENKTKASDYSVRFPSL